MKTRARAAQVIVVNHALLFTDLMIRESSNGYGNMIGDYDVLILDESHEVSQWATNAFGARTNDQTFNYLITDIKSFCSKLEANTDLVSLECDELSGKAFGFFTALPEVGRWRVRSILESEDTCVELIDAIRNVRRAFDAVSIYPR